MQITEASLLMPRSYKNPCKTLTFSYRRLTIALPISWDASALLACVIYLIVIRPPHPCSFRKPPTNCGLVYSIHLNLGNTETEGWPQIGRTRNQ